MSTATKVFFLECHSERQLDSSIHRLAATPKISSQWRDDSGESTGHSSPGIFFWLFFSGQNRNYYCKGILITIQHLLIASIHQLQIFKNNCVTKRWTNGQCNDVSKVQLVTFCVRNPGKWENNELPWSRLNSNNSILSHRLPKKIFPFALAISQFAAIVIWVLSTSINNLFIPNSCNKLFILFH